jgi:uncharacterized protein YigA (DUF484 family)
MNAEDVALYLQQNPEFLADHEDLFTRLRVPHPQHDGQAISLVERQQHALREKIRQLEHKLAQLIAFGEENDEISEKVHRLALALLEAGSFEAVRQALILSLQEDFAVPHVGLRLWGGAMARAETEFMAVSEEAREYFERLRHPYCGTPEQVEVLAWFGEAAIHVRSVALMPLRRHGQLFGLLALGSPEPERFYPGMGTLYLGRIGELAGAALLCEIAS